MAEVGEAPDISGKDSSEDQDVPAKCQDNVEDNVVNEKENVDLVSSEGKKSDAADDIGAEEPEVRTDDEEYLMEELDEAEEQLKRWREKKRKTRSMRRDMYSSDSDKGEPELAENDAATDDEGPDDDDKKNDASAFRNILKRLDASEEKFLCDVCDQMLKTPASLSTHLIRVHKKLKCPECPKFLATQQSLRMHIFTHTPETEWPYECEFCQKRFKLRSDLPKHFDSILHRNDPQIPEKDTDEYYVILDRSFTKPDPISIIYNIKEEDANIVECSGCDGIFVPGPGYDEHLKECEITEDESEEEIEKTEITEDKTNDDPVKDAKDENQRDGDIDKKEDPITEQKDDESLEIKKSSSVEVSADPVEEKKDEPDFENKEDPDGESEGKSNKYKIGPASKIGRPPYKGMKRKMGPASKIGRRQIGPKFLRKKPRLEVDKLSNSTRKCNFCDKILTQLTQMVNHTLSHFADDISKNLPSSAPYICPTCSSEYKEKAPLIRHVAFTHRTLLEHCKEEQIKGLLVACESDDIATPELPAVAKGRTASAKKNAYKRTRSDDEFIDDPGSDYSHSSGSASSSASSADYEYNSGSGSRYSRSSGDSDDSDAADSVDYESGSEDEQDSDDYNIKKPPRALGWESD